MIKVSILIPTFNRAELLKKAIKSVLSQDYENLEVIVSDNASTDNTYEIVSEFFDDNRFKYYKNEMDIGLVNNLKKLVLDYMTGEYFILLGDDDYLIKDDYISKVVNIFENNDNVLIVYSYYYEYFEDINKKHKIIFPFKEIEFGKTVFMNYQKVRNPAMCNTVFNREFAIKTNPFSNEFNSAFDMIMVLKLCLCGDVGIIKDFSSVETQHGKNLSSNFFKNYNYLIGAVDHVIEPYKWALKYNKLSNDEIEEWENRVIFKMFLYTMARTLFFFPEKYQDTLDYLSDKNNKVFQILLNNKIYKFMIFSYKIHLFRTFFIIITHMFQFNFKYKILV